jgi:hypothetical protein
VLLGHYALVPVGFCGAAGAWATPIGGAVGIIIIIVHAHGTGVAEVGKFGGVDQIDAQILEDHLAFAQRGGYLKEFEISDVVVIHVETMA